MEIVERPADRGIPKVDRAAIEQALREFDVEKRSQPEWSNWEDSAIFKYAVSWQGKYYPIKEIVRIATGATVFNSAQARPYLQRLGFEIITLDNRAGNVWIFQANPKFFDLAAKLRTSIRVGDTETWVVSQNHRRMRTGDTVIFWQSGPNGGIYAIGELTNDPFETDSDPDPDELQERPYLKAKWRVDVRFTQILEKPLSRQVVKQHPVLQDLGVLKFSPSTNYRVTPEEWAAIVDLIREESDPVTINLYDTLARSFAASGLHFTEWQVATFCTALQTKGFVILSGISGTGKTKLIQHFATLFPQPQEPAILPEVDQIILTVHPYMLKYSRFIIPRNALQYFVLPDAAEGWDVTVEFGDHNQKCRLTRDQREDGTVVALLLREKARKWFLERFSVDDRFIVEPKLDQEQNLSGFRLIPVAEQSTFSEDTEDGRGRNLLFLPVRPDWRDSKSLLGYFNPLTETYEWTTFLRFLIQAVTSYKKRDGLAWFVVLDEMNLAHVEYYFADLLSVLESGRDAEGWTREPLRLIYPDDVMGEFPPRELYLPPNLYIVGTVNIDETTFAFSPKVLDRAFSLELIEVDFSEYPPQLNGDGPAITDAQRVASLKAFTRYGRFPGVGKRLIANFIASHPEVRTHLQTLNHHLRRQNLHFGYRVFDEIIMFLAIAEENKLFAKIGGSDAAFDTAVLMKVLPKFHGSRGKLEEPLKAVLAWCSNPESPNLESIESSLRETRAFDGVPSPPDALGFQYPKTANRVLRMLRELRTDGFTAFG